MAKLTELAQKQIVRMELDEQVVYANLQGSLLVPIWDVGPNSWNPKTCQDDRLCQIARSLQKHGWQPSDLPLVAEGLEGAANRYTIINGEHRWLICNWAGFKQFPVTIATSVKTDEDGMALTMALEEAKARRDGKKFAENLVKLAVAGRDEELRGILRVRDPEALRQQRERFASKLAGNKATGGAVPKLVSLVMTNEQHVQWTLAIRSARTKLLVAQATIDMVQELADREIVALAAALRNVSEDVGKDE
jgi:hypothetical protein